jgi:hypothetical protein
LRRASVFLLVTVLTIAGFALRLHNLGQASFRGDEAFTIINWVRPPLLQTLASDIPTKDPQPLLAYALFHTWGRAFGDGEFTMRLLPTLASTLGIPVLYALGRRIGGQRMGLLAALLWAVHPLQIWHAQDARNYAVWATLSALALWLALRALEKQRRVDWVLYATAATAAAYTYYLELFTLFVLNLFVVIDLLVVQRPRAWRVFRSWVVAQIMIGLLLAPWFLQPRLLVGSGYGGTRGGDVDPIQLVTRFLPTLNFGTSIPSETIWPILVIILAGGLWVLRRHRYGLLLGLLGTIPLILLAIISLRLDVFVPRYVLAAAPAYILIFVGLLTLIQNPILRRILPVILLGGWLYIDVQSLMSIDYTNANWRDLAIYLREHVQANDHVIQAAADEAMTFYYADVDRLPANPTQNANEIISTLENRRDTHRSLWLVGRTFPDWPSKDVVPAWFTEHMQLVRETTAGNLPVWQYMPWEVKAGEIEDQPQAAFGEIAELIGVTIQQPDPDGDLTVWAYWRATGQSEQPLKVFVHLVGDVNPSTGTPLWAQDDQLPQDGRISTTNWVTGEIYRDIYTLDVGIAGEYTLLVGLYDPQNGDRVRVSGSGSDSFEAGTVTIP